MAILICIAASIGVVLLVLVLAAMRASRSHSSSDDATPGATLSPTQQTGNPYRKFYAATQNSLDDKPK